PERSIDHFSFCGEIRHHGPILTTRGRVQSGRLDHAVPRSWCGRLAGHLFCPPLPLEMASRPGWECGRRQVSAEGGRRTQRLHAGRLMVYLLCGLLGGAILAAICTPLFRKETSLESSIIEETHWDLLQRKKEVILGNIQDLEFEYKCGKLSEEDYQKIRAEMNAEAAQVFQEVETLESSADLDALIRREISARKNRSNAKQVTCPSCSSKNPITNKFCADCGAKLKP